MGKQNKEISNFGNLGIKLYNFLISSSLFNANILLTCEGKVVGSTTCSVCS